MYERTELPSELRTIWRSSTADLIKLPTANCLSKHIKGPKKEKQRDNILDGVPKKLPALIRARRIQEKAANVGFDWKELSPVLDKVDEEIEELKIAIKLI
mgnify:CR=1 FL=1